MKRATVDIRVSCAACGHEMESKVQNGVIVAMPCLHCIRSVGLAQMTSSPKAYNYLAECHGFDTRWDKDDYCNRNGCSISREEWSKQRSEDSRNDYGISREEWSKQQNE